MRRSSVLLTLAMLLFGGHPAFADTVILFSNFGPGGSYGSRHASYSWAWAPLDEGDVSQGQSMASSFSLVGPARFTAIDIALGVLEPPGSAAPPIDVTLQLVRDQ